MRILYTTDLHGHHQKYRRLLPAAREHRVDAVINGGDMLPKNRDMFTQDRFITDHLEDHFRGFQEAGIPYLCCLGNDDLRIFDDLFEQTCARYDVVTNLAQRRHRLNGHEFVGMNWVVDYPFRLKDRCRKDTPDYQFQMQLGTGLLSTDSGWHELDDWPAFAATLPTLEEELEKLVQPEDMSRAVYVIHMPPEKRGLDRCASGPEVGSKALYDFFQRHQPRLGLHGHIHESPELSGHWYGAIGRTVCIQPGQMHPFTYVIIDLEKMEFERHTE